jgi:hypothetical protein
MTDRSDADARRDDRTAVARSRRRSTADQLTLDDASLVATALPGAKLTVWTQPSPARSRITGVPAALTLDKLR